MNWNKNIMLLIPIIGLVNFNCFAQQGMWTWMHGSNTPNSAGNYGTMGVAAPTNDPPNSYEVCEWTDLQGNFWMFGGIQYIVNARSSALWKFDPVTNMWIWVKGPNTTNNFAVFGTQGVPSPNNNPGAISYGVMTWVDNQNNLWLFGGYGHSLPGEFGYLAALWKYDIATNMWTWMSGPNTTDQPGVYGTQGVEAPANYPPARDENNGTWTDNNGCLWLFGGDRLWGTAGVKFNDLWKYNPSTNMWTWVNGSNIPNSTGSYGVQGVPSATNQPSARAVYSKWKDLDGNFWLFGGQVITQVFNDLWKYNITTNMWTWVRGSNIGNIAGSYGTQCVPDSTNDPHPRYENRACWTDNCGNFWMFGGDRLSSSINDLWHYNVQINNWTWVSGSNVYSSGNYGTMGVSLISNIPRSRLGALSFKENNGNLWVFGGSSDHNLSAIFNDLWRYVPDTNCVDVCLPPATQAIFTSSDISGCAPYSVSFINNSHNANTLFWDFGDGATSTSFAPSHIYTTPGQYTVTLIASSGTEGDTLTQVNYISVLPNATANFSASSNIVCVGGTLNFTNSSANALTYHWAFGDGATSTSTNSSHSWNSAATYDMELIAYNASGCSDTITQQITIQQIISANTNSTQSSCSVNDGTATVTPIGGSGNYTYLWTPGNQTTQTAIALGANMYSVLVTDGNNCSETASATVTNPNAPGFSSDSLTHVLCNGDSTGSTSVVFTGGIAPYTYLWSPSNQTTQTAINITAGTYTVTVTDDNNCSNFHNIVITEPDEIVLSIDSEDATCGEQNGYITVVPDGGTGLYTYVWMPMGATTSDINGIGAGTYSLTVSDENGCNENAIVTIDDGINFTVSLTQNGDTLYASSAPNYQWYFNDTLIPGVTSQDYLLTESGYYYVVATEGNCSDTSNIIETTCLCVGINENEFANSISIYPNPTNNKITIEIRKPKGVYELYDSNGKLLLNCNVRKTKFTIDLSMYSKGVYFLRIVDGGQQASRKIIKE